MGVSLTALWRRLARGRGGVGVGSKCGAVGADGHACGPERAGSVVDVEIPDDGQLWNNPWRSWQLPKIGPCLPLLSAILMASWRAHDEEESAQEQECEMPE